MGRKRLSGGWNPRVERRGPRLRPGTVVGVLLLLGVVIGVAHNRLRAQNRPDPLLGGVQAVALPLQKTTAQVQQGASSTWRGLFGGIALEQENRSLKAQRDAARLELERLRAHESENTRLRGLLKLVERSTPAPQVADIIAWIPSELEQTITIARGARHGVQLGMAARTAEGLVGKVVDVGPLTAKVRLLTDPDSGVGVRVGERAFGILKGREEAGSVPGHRYVLEVVHLDRSIEIPIGAPVRTSGHGGVFPPDIPVGTVESVEEDSTHLLRVARITPSAEQPGSLRQVLLIAPLGKP